MTLGFEMSVQIAIIGALTGLAYAVLAAGLVLVYRATRVINFAHAQLGALCGAVLAKLVIDVDWPYVPAFVLVTGLGAVIGGLIEILVIRRLFASPRLIVLVATIGISQILLFVELRFISVESNALYPTPISHSVDVGSLRLLGQHFMLIAFVPAMVVGLSMFLNRTPFGVAIRAAADDTDLARLHGISSRRVSTTVWIIAGALAAITAVLLNPVRGTVPGAENVALGPALLLRALAAALVGRMSSLPRTLVGGVALGVVEAVLIASYGPAEVDLVLLLAVLGLVYVFSRKAAAEPDVALTVRVRPIPARLLAIPWVRQLGLRTALGAFAVAALLPLLFDRPSQIYLFSRVVVFAVIGVSLTVLTGWAGQLSLGQFAFVALGAYTTFALHDRGVPFAVAGVWSLVAGALLALAIGLPALRIRGLFLAVTTLAFAVAMSTWGLTRTWLVGEQPVALIRRPELGPVDFASQTTYYYLCLVVLAGVLVAVVRLRRTGPGRALIAMRDNHDAAAAYTVSPTRVKLSAFAVSGAIAALAGWLLAGLLPAFNAQIFGPEESLRVASMAIIGGLTTVAGGVLGAIWVVGIPALFTDVRGVELATSGVGLLLLVLYLPSGLAGAVVRGRDALFAWLDARQPEREGMPAVTVAPVASRSRRETPSAIALEVRDITVEFGGLKAVNGVSLAVPAGATVGLIGSNGAGKSTLMNAISGFVPHRGTVELLGVDLGRRQPHQRALAGVGRSFQDARLFENLTVRESIKVALERAEASELVPSMFGFPSSRRAERTKSARADELVALLGLGRYADTFVAELSTGTRRIVELAGLLALDTPVLLLDEPTAGIAQREVEAFGPLLGAIRDELGATVLLIEHDMGLIMSMSDHVYCMETGKVIASGPPEAVRNDPRVIASYLGTDERAIARSDAGRERVGA